MSAGRASQHIRDMVCGYGPSKRGGHHLATIQAYIDDSGNSEAHGNPVFVLAGYISTADKWAKFSDEWEDECARSPRIENFKMAHANTFKGDFDGWDRVVRDERLLKLAGIVRRNTVLRIQTSIGWDDYNAVLRGNVPGIYDNPYLWVFYRLITSMTAWQARQNYASKVDFIFDYQCKFGRQAAKWFEPIRDFVSPEERARMGSITHKDDQEVLPLKAADMWAWHVRRYLAEGYRTYPHTGQLPGHSELMKSLMHCEAVGEPLERSDLEDALAAFRRGAEAAKNSFNPYAEE